MSQLSSQFGGRMALPRWPIQQFTNQGHSWSRRSHFSARWKNSDRGRGIIQKRAFIFSMPLDSSFANFPVHVRFGPSGSFGKHSAEICVEIVAQLKNSAINVLAVASDGERACLRRHDTLFVRYLDRPSAPMTELAQLIDYNEIWEVADPLHAFKCQRCRPVRSLTFSPRSRSFCARP
jgi:hypothetical protein